MAGIVAGSRSDLLGGQHLVPVLDSGDYYRLRARFDLRPSTEAIPGIGTPSGLPAENAPFAIGDCSNIRPLLDTAQSFQPARRFLLRPVGRPAGQAQRLRRLSLGRHELSLSQSRFLRLAQSQLTSRAGPLLSAARSLHQTGHVQHRQQHDDSTPRHLGRSRFLRLTAALSYCIYI